jgi:hypothetical protein
VIRVRRGRRPGFATGLAALALLSLSLLGPIGVSAASAEETPSPVPTPQPTSTTSYNTRDTEFSLTVSPTRLVLTSADSGTTQEVLVVNQGETTTHVDVQKRDFTGGRNGSLVFEADSEYSATDWVDVTPVSFDLAPGQAQTVTATVSVPSEPAPDVGDHQVALVFIVPSGDTGANVKINRGVATPVYVTVPGDVDDTVTVSGLSAPWFSAGDPVTVSATVENSGNVHRDFRGDSPLAIEGTDSAVFADFTVARGTTRDITAEWQPPVFCICDLSVSIENASGVSESQSVRVIVFPVVAALIVLGVLVAVTVVVLVLRRARQNARPKGGQRHARA